MHQPTIETAFRRGSFGIETALNTPLPTSEAAQQFTELLNRPDRPIPSRRSSMRAMPNTFIPPPPPPPPASVPVVDPTRLSSSMRSPSPVDITTIRQPRRSPVRPPPLPSSPPRGNSSQAEHFTRLSPPNSASKRAYSFAREQALRPSVIGIGPRPPARTNSCPPDADIFKTRMMRSNSDGYTSASTSFVTEGSSSPTSSDSSQPSDNEDPNIKTNDHAFNLEVESRRLELVWRETEKQWKERYGITLPRSQEMAFRQHVEGGVRHEDDGPKEKEWRDMWKNTNASWSEFEARWRQDEAQKRRNDDTHFHTAHSDSRGMAFADDDKVMNTIFTHFEKEMEKRRLRAERKRLEEVQQTERDRRDRERPTWQATVDRESESRRSSGQGVGDRPENWLQDRLQERLRPDMNRTRSSSVVVESRPTFQRSRSGSVATIVDPLSTDAVPPPPPPPSSFVTPQLDTSHTRPKHKRSSRGSRESFGSVGTEEEAQRAEEHRAEEIKRHYMDGARRQHYTAAPTDNAWGSSARPDKPRHDQRPHPDSDLPRVQEERSIPPTPHPDLRPSPSFTHDAPPPTPGLSPSIEEHLKILEREQAELARRIQELRAAAEGAKSPAPPAEPERGREKDKPKDKEREKPKGEPRAKSQGGRKHQEDEGGVFKAMQERLREAEGRRPPEKAPDAVRKPKRATLATLETEPTTPIRVPAGDADTSASRVHFASSKPSVEDLPSPTPPRVRTPGPGPRVMTPARVRTPSPRSQSPVGAPSIASSNATRDTASTNDIASTVHEAVARETPLKIQTTVIQPAPRPALKSRDTNAERPKSGTTSTLAVPHVNTSSSSPVESVHNDVSPMGAKTPRATTFDPDRTPRAQSGPVPEQADKAEPAPRVYISPNQARARAEGTGVRVEEETTKRRVDAAMGATVAAAAAEAFDRAGGKKRSKEAELRAQEERRASEEQLAREQRRAEEERKLREERRAEDVRRREAAERREREEQARYEREKRERERLERERQERERQERERQDRERERQERDRQEERRRRWAEPAYERARPPIRENVADAWNSYELRWAALALPTSTQPITFRNIPWPMVGVPADPEAITAQAVGAFLLSPLHSQDKSRKERIRNAMLRWHSDKFEGRWMARIDESEQPIIKEAVGAVARALTELMAKPDQY